MEGTPLPLEQAERVLEMEADILARRRLPKEQFSRVDDDTIHGHGVLMKDTAPSIARAFIDLARVARACAAHFEYGRRSVKRERALLGQLNDVLSAIDPAYEHVKPDPPA